MLDFYDLFSTNSNNAMWTEALQMKRRASRVIAVASAKDTANMLKAMRGGPGVYRVSNAETVFAWCDGAVTAPMTREGAVVAVDLAWQHNQPPFVPQGAIVWISESRDNGRRYWVTWPVGRPFSRDLGFHVEDIT